MARAEELARLKATPQHILERVIAFIHLPGSARYIGKYQELAVRLECGLDVSSFTDQDSHFLLYDIRKELYEEALDHGIRAVYSALLDFQRLIPSLE